MILLRLRYHLNNPGQLRCSRDYGNRRLHYRANHASVQLVATETSATLRRLFEKVHVLLG